MNYCEQHGFLNGNIGGYLSAGYIQNRVSLCLTAPDRRLQLMPLISPFQSYSPLGPASQVD